MSIENSLERIAAAAERIANALDTAPGAAAPAATIEPKIDPETDTRSPQQKAADTRKANAAKKKAEEAAAAAGAPATPDNVTPITPAAADAAPAADPVAPAAVTEAPVAEVIEGESYPIPGTQEEMLQIATGIAQQLGPRQNEIGELLVNTYKVGKLSDLPIEYYAGFSRDLHALVSGVA